MLSTSTKYALCALRCLAEQHSGEYVSIELISKEAQVPRPYLAKLIKGLAKKKIVITKKGLNGGVMFRPKGKLTFYDVCGALDDPIVNQSCLLSKGPCGGKSPCQFHRDWGKVREKMIGFLKRTAF